jgi:ABC-type Fe3+-hydroxamate transport system substrate-binding protein
VGRTSACNYPPEIVERVPVLADFGVPAIEAILAARPDFVLHVDLEDKADSKQMASAGIRSVRVPCNTLDDIPRAVEAVGALVGREEEAAALASGIRREYALRRQSATRERPRVLVEIWDDPITTVGRDSFIAEAIALAGGENIGNEASGPYFQVSPEWAVERNPDVILCFHSKGVGVRKLSRRTGWDTISAVKTGKVFDSLNLDCIMRPGPRIAEGLRDLEKAFAAEDAR